MLGTDPLDLQHVRHLLESALQVLARLHQVLEVVNVREVELEILEKLGLALGKVLVRQDAEEVAEVIAAVERQPLDVVEQNDPWEYNSDTYFTIESVLQTLLKPAENNKSLYFAKKKKS